MKHAKVSSSARWTAEEEATLVALWKRHATRETLCAALPGRSWCAICGRAALRWLPRLPEGWCTLAEASRRSGFCHDELARLLEQLGVKSRPHPRPSHLRGTAVGCRWRIVSWRVLEPRLREHLAALGETVAQAAARLDVNRVTLYGWAREEGLYESPGRGRVGRLQRAVWDELAARRRGETVVAAAQRLGLHPTTLRGWLRRRHGARDGARRVVRRDAAFYDALAAEMRRAA